MNFGIIGLNWGAKYIKNINELGHKVVGLCATSHNYYKYLDESVRHYSYWTPYYLDLVNDKTIDTIVIASPPSTHKDMILACIAAQKNIIVEKPLVTNLEELEIVKSALRTHKKSFVVNYIHLWNPDFEKFAIDYSGKLIFSISCGNKKRPDYSFLWDYGSHDVAMFLAINGIKYPSSLSLVLNDCSGYQFILSFKNQQLVSDFKFNSNKLRQMSYIKNKESVYFTDSGEHNSLRHMLFEFINAPNLSNIDLADMTTRIIVALESQK